MPSDTRRDERALRAVWRELRRPRTLLGYLRKSGDLALPLIFAGPTFVLVSYVVAFAATPADRAGAEFHSAAAQILPVLLLVLAVEGQVFRWEGARSSLSIATRDDIVSDERFRRFASDEGPVSDAVDAVLDATVDAARNIADTFLRQATALLLLTSMLVGEVIALVPLLTDEIRRDQCQAGDGGDRRRLRRRRLRRDHGVEVRRGLLQAAASRMRARLRRRMRETCICETPTRRATSDCTRSSRKRSSTIRRACGVQDRLHLRASRAVLDLREAGPRRRPKPDHRASSPSSRTVERVRAARARGIRGLRALLDVVSAASASSDTVGARPSRVSSRVRARRATPTLVPRAALAPATHDRGNIVSARQGSSAPRTS